MSSGLLVLILPLLMIMLAMKAPTMPTTILSRMPCWPSVRITRLASQPTIPPMTIQIRNPVIRVSLLFVAALRVPSGIKTRDARVLFRINNRLSSRTRNEKAAERCPRPPLVVRI